MSGKGVMTRSFMDEGSSRNCLRNDGRDSSASPEKTKSAPASRHSAGRAVACGPPQITVSRAPGSDLTGTIGRPPLLEEKAERLEAELYGSPSFREELIGKIGLDEIGNFTVAEGVLILGPSAPWLSHNLIQANKGAGVAARDGAKPSLVGNLFDRNVLEPAPTDAVKELKGPPAAQKLDRLAASIATKKALS